MKRLTTIIIFFTLITTDLFAGTAPTNSPHMPAPSHTDEIRDIKDIIVQPGINAQWYWIGSGILLLFLLAGIFFYLKRKNKKQQSLAAHEKAFKALESARLLMTPDQSRKFAVRMADILRQYIENRFQFSLQNLTTREFLYELMSNPETMPSALQDYDEMLRDWLNHCDLVKFAKYHLNESEMEQMYNSVTDFITSTRTRGDEK